VRAGRLRTSADLDADAPRAACGADNRVSRVVSPITQIPPIEIHESVVPEIATRGRERGLAHDQQQLPCEGAERLVTLLVQVATQ
jgi:hypothetical protein